MIDLHVHSTFSDGSMTPEELVDLAMKCGLSALALTDHDTTEGIESLLEAGERACRDSESGNRTLTCIPGVEMSVAVERGTMHILGYFIDAGNRELESLLARVRGGRNERNEKILSRLCELGLSLEMSEVLGFAGDGVVGRPHFARALVEKEYVKSHQAAFEKYLAKGRPAYVDRYRPDARESIEVISNAGGVPAVSHPSTLGLGPKALRVVLEELIGAGLQGIEAYYSEHSPEVERKYVELADSLGLVATGGSDFHGDLNPAIRLGRGFGRLRVPDSVVDELRERKVSRRDAPQEAGRARLIRPAEIAEGRDGCPARER
ncbi:MAG: PHP domain-containing protein [Kiritimatiellia bacterium]|jgi:hypothetical protein|nr:PHP domain-containing protein [Kiritimatiellia bacterium]MDP6847735.1 PHP domain-containing protein [Kiritimatiellia bacterium]